MGVLRTLFSRHLCACFDKEKSAFTFDFHLNNLARAVEGDPHLESRAHSLFPCSARTLKESVQGAFRFPSSGREGRPFYFQIEQSCRARDE